MIKDLSRGLTLPGANNLAKSIVSEDRDKEWWRIPDFLPFLLDVKNTIYDVIPFSDNQYVQQVLDYLGVFSFMDDLDSFFDPFYIQYSVGGYFFDGVIRSEHTHRSKITEHPVQTGANISDHAFVEPKELVIEVAMSDAMKDKESGQFGLGDGRSVSAYGVLVKLQEERQPLEIVTPLATYNNMLIQTIDIPVDYKTRKGLRATVTFKEIIMATVTEAKVSSRPQTTDQTNGGDLQAESTQGSNASILVQSGAAGTQGSNPGGI